MTLTEKHSGWTDLYKVTKLRNVCVCNAMYVFSTIAWVDYEEINWEEEKM